jgi:hypothetical protein
MFLSSETWHYICRQLSPVVSPAYFTKDKSKPIQYCDLSLVTKTYGSSYVMLRIMDQQSVAKARKLFGRTFGIGCRNLPPHKGHGIRKLLHRDIINIINVDLNDNQHTEGFREFVAAQGVELVFNPETRALSIRVRYSKVNAEDPMVSVALNFTRSDLIAQPPIQQHRSNRVVLVGTKFLHMGELVEVTASNYDSVLIRNVMNGNEQPLSAAVARNLIRQYIVGN